MIRRRARIAPISIPLPSLAILVWLIISSLAAAWWPRPAKILKDLALLLIAGGFTMVVLQQQARIPGVGLVTPSAILTIATEGLSHSP